MKEAEKSLAESEPKTGRTITLATAGWGWSAKPMETGQKITLAQAKWGWSAKPMNGWRAGTVAAVVLRWLAAFAAASVVVLVIQHYLGWMLGGIVVVLISPLLDPLKSRIWTKVPHKWKPGRRPPWVRFKL